MQPLPGASRTEGIANRRQYFFLSVPVSPLEFSGPFKAFPYAGISNSFEESCGIAKLI